MHYFGCNWLVNAGLAHFRSARDLTVNLAAKARVPVDQI